MGLGYSTDPDPERTAKVLGRELQIKPRHAIEVANFLRGKPTDEAKDMLRGVFLGANQRPPLPADDDEERQRILNLPKRAVPFRKHNASMGHKPNGVGPGAYPVKAAREFLKLIEQAEANAEYKGLDADRLVIEHCAAQRGRVIRGMMPRARGRGTDWNTSLTHVEIVVAEQEEEA